MSEKAEVITESVVVQWMRDMGLSPNARSDARANWVYEVQYPATGMIHYGVANSRATPRAVTIACRMTPSPEQATAFRNLKDEAKRDFWRKLRAALHREFVEFQIEGAPFNECPVSFQVSSVRYDDGLSLDSFARTLSSVHKACIDGCAVFEEELGVVATVK